MTLGDFRKITVGLDETTPIFCESQDPLGNYIICVEAVRVEADVKGMAIIFCENGDWGE